MHRFKILRQVDYNECGATCIRMIASYYGLKIPREVLRNNLDIAKQGMTISEICDTFKDFGFNAKAVKLPFDSLQDMPLPAILFWKESHFIVLYKTTKRYVYIADPSQGKLRFSYDDFSNFWTTSSGKNIAILVDPTDNINIPFPNTIQNSSHGLRMTITDGILSNKSGIALITVFSILLMACDILSPFLFRDTIDEGLTGRNISLIWVLILSQFIIYFVGSLASNATQIILTKTGLSISLSLTSKYFKNLLTLPFSIFERKNNADLIHKVSDLERIKEFILRIPDSYIYMAFSIVVFSFILILFNVWVFCVFIILSAIEFTWTILFLNKRKALDYSLFTRNSNNQQLIYEMINGIQEIKTNNAQHHKIRIWQASQTKLNSLRLKSLYLGIWSEGGRSLISQAKSLIITGICACFVAENYMSIGTMMTIGYLSGRLSVPFSTLWSGILQYQNAGISMERISDIIMRQEPPKKHQITSAGDIEIKDMWFKYPGSKSPWVLKNINLNIKQGETIAFVGESGCGKTTILKIILGLYTPQRGYVKTGNYSLENIDIDSWLAKCATVLQDGYIFSGTILENISLCDENPDIERAFKSLNSAGIKETVENMPGGIYSKIGNSGQQLSGGQKQRICIARALYKNPDILILDEATSSLDAANEHRIVKNLQTQSKQRTTLIAAHRLSTIIHADKIVYLENGEIIECGSHEQLINLRGKYYALMQHQINP